MTEQTQETIKAVTPWIVQTRALVSPSEGGGLLAALRPVAKSLAATTDDSIELFKQVDLTSRCFSDIILPAGNQEINDALGSSGVQAYKEFWYAITGFGGQRPGLRRQRRLPAHGQRRRQHDDQDTGDHPPRQERAAVRPVAGGADR